MLAALSESNEMSERARIPSKAQVMITRARPWASCLPDAPIFPLQPIRALAWGVRLFWDPALALERLERGSGRSNGRLREAL